MREAFESTHRRTIKIFSDGWKMDELLSFQALQEEAGRTASCLDDEMGYLPEMLYAGTGTFLSLRDPKDQAHMSIVISKATGVVSEASGLNHATGPQHHLVGYLSEFFAENEYKLSSAWHYIGLVQTDNELVDINNLPDPLYLDGSLDMSFHPRSALPSRAHITKDLFINAQSIDGANELSVSELIAEGDDIKEKLGVQGQAKIIWRNDQNQIHRDNGLAMIAICEDEVVIWHQRNGRFERNPDEGPALIRMQKDTGQVKFAQYFVDGKNVPAPNPETNDLIS